MTEREALKLALEELAVRFNQGWHEGIKIDASDIMVLSNAAEALAQPEQDPVATVQCINGLTIGYLDVMQPVGTKLYTNPPQRKPLTLNWEPIQEFWRNNSNLDWGELETAINAAAHGIKE